jgi:hypothetical protein
VLPLTGGIMTGPLQLANQPQVAMDASTKLYVDDAIAALPPPGMGDAPSDSNFYVRQNAAWEILPLWAADDRRD